MSSQSIAIVADVREQFGNPEERRRLLLEAVTRRLIKTATDDTIVYL
jgi:hypothetical protein